jgi:hypothetical protein
MHLEVLKMKMLFVYFIGTQDNFDTLTIQADNRPEADKKFRNECSRLNIRKNAFRVDAFNFVSRKTKFGSIATLAPSA